jgi:hypothetical protein
MSLGISHDWVASVPPSVTLPVGATTATFTITAAARMTGIIQVMASYGGSNLWQEIRVIAGLDTLTVSPAAVAGGTTATGTVRLTNAPVEVAGVGLGSGNPAVAAVPAQVVVVPLTQSSTFTITTQPVSAPTLVSIWAVSGPVRTAQLWVMPVGLSLTPARVQGGKYSTATLVLPAPAPAGGTVVPLSSSSRAVAAPPASVTVPAGARLATFPVRTFPVGVSTPVTLSAAFGGVTWSQTLTVVP